MSEKKAPETPVDKYNKLSRDIKHQRKALETAQRNVEKTEKSLAEVLKKLWFCPNCNQPQVIPNKKECDYKVLSLNDNGKQGFYRCKFVQCHSCKQVVMIDKVFIDDDD